MYYCTATRLKSQSRFYFVIRALQYVFCFELQAPSAEMKEKASPTKILQQTKQFGIPAP